ncbi:MAG: CoA activase [Thermoproteota archaeon]|nr:MAG: CoA activase [Candidatus Korarchaeota archaeon]
MLTAGIDIGGKNVKVLLLKDGEIIARAKAVGGFEQGKVTEELLEKVLRSIGISRRDIEGIGVTGSGRKYAPPHEVAITEIGAAARGASFIIPSARTVIDCGAEDSRGIKVEGGVAKDFATNDKCAAGAGAFCEAMARALEVSLEDFGKISLNSTKKVPINAQCVVFAESEVVSLINSKTPKEDIARAVNEALAERVVAMVKRVGHEEDIVVVGGMAKNIGFVEGLKQGFGTDVIVPEFPEYIGALGAALAAREKN